MSGVLSPRRRLYPPACRPYGLEAEPEAAGFRPRRTKVRLPATAGHATENPCLSRHSPFSGDGGCGLAHRTLILNLALIYELETT